MEEIKMKLTESQENLLHKIVDKSLDLILREQTEYQNCFKVMLKKFNTKSPFQLPLEKRKSFFNAVKSECSKFKKNK